MACRRILIADDNADSADSLGELLRMLGNETRIAEAAWLAGYWEGEGLGGRVEDLWMPPAGGVMLGAFRLTRDGGRPGMYELFAIEEHEASLRFVVKHFNPDWVGWEEKDKFLALALTRAAPGELAFGGVVFRREADDVLAVDLTIRLKDGSQRQERLRFRKKPL
jgi:hypothetical protein